MNSDDRVPKTTPRIIANEKLRIESPPLIVDRVTDHRQDSTDEYLVDFQ